MTFLFSRREVPTRVDTCLDPWRDAPFPRRKPMEDIEAIRKELWQGCRIIHGAGLVRETGHLSVRLSNDTFLMPPRKSPGVVKLDEMLIFDRHGNLLDGKGEPNSETLMHVAIYEHRPDVMSVAHTHSEMCIVLGAAGIPLKPVHNNGAMFGPEVRVYEEVGLIHSKEQANRLAIALGHDHALLLRGHGTIVTGDSIKRAVVGAIRIEYCARLQVLAMSIGKPYSFSHEECNRLGAKINLNRFWDYHLETCGLLEGNKGKRGSKKI